MANEQRMRPRKRKKVCAFCVDKGRSSAGPDHRHQAGPSDRSAALRRGLIITPPEARLPGVVFLQLSDSPGKNLSKRERPSFPVGNEGRIFVRGQQYYSTSSKRK